MEGTSSNAPIVNEDIEQKVSNSKQRRRYKGKKRPSATGRTWTKVEDKNAPRRPRSAYVLFLSTTRSKYGTSKQGCDQSAINTALAKEWQELTNEARQVFIDKAAAERELYAKQMEEYKRTAEYAEFLAQKDMVMEQRRQQRKAAYNSDQDADEGFSSISLNARSTFHSKRKKMVIPARVESVFSPTVKGTDIPIFDPKFVLFNKDREMDLRSVRRFIGIADDEEQAMRRVMENLHENCLAMQKQIVSEEKEVINLEKELQRWKTLCCEVLGCGSSEIIETMEAVAEGSDNVLLMNTRSALNNIIF